MSKPVNKTMIGVFVVGAIALVVVAIGVLGSGKLFKESIPYVMVFEGSVKGLNVGSPVVFRGVKIGSVSDIRMRFNYTTKAMTILVYSDFGERQIEIVNLDQGTAERLKEAGSVCGHERTDRSRASRAARNAEHCDRPASNRP